MGMERNRCPDCGSSEIIEKRDIYGVSRKLCRNCMCGLGQNNIKEYIINPLKSIYNKGVEIETDLTNSIKRKQK